MKPWKWVVLILFWFTMLFTLKQCGEPPQKIVEQPVSEETTMHVVSYDDIHQEEPEEPELEEQQETYLDEIVLLAKIMKAESGVDWPDFAIMAVGEVVLNRVASNHFPNSIKEVLEQSEPSIQYEPVHSNDWLYSVPEKRYLVLAQRLIDGERVLNDERIVYQSLYSELGTVVMTYTDTTLNTTTYFSRED